MERPPAVAFLIFGLWTTESFSCTIANMHSGSAIRGLPPPLLIVRQLRDTTQLAENTLLFTADSCERLILLPYHPGSGVFSAHGDTAINSVLHSEWYVLIQLLK